MKKNQRGFTMGEVLLVTSLISFATTGVMTLVSKKAKTNNGEQYYRQMVMDGRGTVDQIAKELRRAGLPQHAGNANINSSNSNKVAANTFLVANSDQIVFEADLDDNGSVERVEYRLKGETRAVIPPAVGQGWQVNALDRVLDVGGPDAQRVEREHDACKTAEMWRQQGDGSGDLARAGDQQYLAREGHPARHDQQQRVGDGEMSDSGQQIKRRHRPAHGGADGWTVHARLLGR